MKAGTWVLWYHRLQGKERRLVGEIVLVAPEGTSIAAGSLGALATGKSLAHYASGPGLRAKGTRYVVSVPDPNGEAEYLFAPDPARLIRLPKTPPATNTIGTSDALQHPCPSPDRRR